MAGRGPSPAAQRRRRNEPERGDWVMLPRLRKPLLPVLPKRGKDELPWSARTKASWAAWRQDPATAMFGAGEIQDAIDLAYVYEQWARDGTAALAKEVRQRKDDLGLTLKGKQDRRWRVAAADEPAAAEPVAPASVTPLRIVRASSS